MDYREFLAAHRNADAEFTIAVKPVGRDEASEFGILKVDPDPAAKGRIVEFVEKPKTDEQLDALKTDTTLLGLTPEEAEKKPYLASMGIYLFQTDILRDLVEGYPEMNDFGKEIIPAAIRTRRVHAYCFDDYWADIGTIRAFFEANLDLVNPMPRFNLFDPERPVYTNQRFLPGAKLNQARLNHSMVCEGAIVEDASVQHSILGVRARVSKGARIENCLVMGADYYQPGGAEPVIGIGEGSHLHNAIVDKNASIGPNVELVNRAGLEKYDDPEGRFYVRDGIVVVAKNSIIPADFSF
jgi:glucose-1-phosphate adenylyltransferase